ncbi:SusD/RagB family nutrient-binding outer membrane lipoprotein [Aquimarina macrocephali]|uniref:SusD/RagB family nutrient-binding outer membrane lipoprotein n=1 Tax=Aquimarina macrocephali TaxID=666563 RepID=UPI003F66306F
MKNSKILAILFCLFTIFSCKVDDLNVSDKQISEVPSTTLFTNGQRNLVDQMVTQSIFDNHLKFYAQYWAGTGFIGPETNFQDLKSFPQNYWNTLYRDVLSDLNEAARLIPEEEVFGFTEIDKQNRLAIIEILKVYTFHVLVDLFGDVPYSEALSLDDNILNPAYDDDQSIYTNIINQLNTAISNLNTSGKSFGDSDLIYQGDVSKWAKFANSLKLRLALRIADVDSNQAGTLATEAVNSGVFTANADNASLEYETTTPNTNPIWETLVNSGREDYVVAEAIVDIMQPINDPRQSGYFDNNLTPYVGGILGNLNVFDNFTHIGTAFHQPDLEGLLFDYAEVEFLLAEAAERSLVGSPADAENHYNNAITASITYWGGSSGDATTYLGQASVAYTTATGNYRQKIGTQQWIAFYNRGFEGWSSYRRLGFPNLNDSSEGNPVPRRIKYPIREYNTNGTNVTNAASNIGGDELSTKIFWDVN